MNKTKCLLLTWIATLSYAHLASSVCTDCEQYSDPYVDNYYQLVQTDNENCNLIYMNYERRGYEISADWLYWRTCRTNLDYVAFITRNVDTNLETFDIHSIGDRWNSGYRLFLGKSFCSSHTLGIRYTNYNNTMKDAVLTQDDFDVIVPMRLPMTVSTVIEYAVPIEANYHINLQVVDFEISSTCSLCPQSSFSFEPFGAIRLASIRQKLTSSFITTNSDEFNIKEKDNHKGYGALLGSKFAFETFCCLQFFGKVSLGGLLSKTSLKHTEDILQISDNSTVLVEEYNNNLCHPIFFTEVAGGIRCELYELFQSMLSLEIGYEFNGWYQLSDFLTFLEGDDVLQISHADSTLHFDGIYMRLDLKF